MSGSQSDQSSMSVLFWGLGLTAVAVSLSAGFLPSGAMADQAPVASAISVLNRDPAEITGPDSCAECHTGEHRVWMDSAHQADAQTLTRDPEAKRIAAALGVRRMKSDARCASCHFTTQHLEGKRPRSISGVSCESCHNAASAWIDPHAKFGLGIASASDETAQHRADRLEYCDSMGMIRPARLYELGSSCYSCHAIHDQELLQTAGHPVGDDFEFASWSQGSIRHNFIRSGSDQNPRSAPERIRVMFLVGAALRLEYACAAVADGAPLDAVHAAVEKLEQINGVAGLDDVAQLIEIGRGVTDPASAAAATGRVGAIGRAIVENQTGSGAVELDALIPEPRAGAGVED